MPFGVDITFFTLCSLCSLWFYLILCMDEPHRTSECPFWLASLCAGRGPEDRLETWPVMRTFETVESVKARILLQQVIRKMGKESKQAK